MHFRFSLHAAMLCKRAKRRLDIFPWASDTDEEERAQQQQQRMQPDTRKSIGPSDVVKGSISYDFAPDHVQAGKVLAHCQNCIQRLRFAVGEGSLKIVIYKIGITHDCTARFELYKAHNWTRMVVMASSEDLGLIEMLEAALISHHNRGVQCRNVLLGGEGMRDKDFSPKFRPPFYCYCVAARADLPKWII